MNGRKVLLGLALTLAWVAAGASEEPSAPGGVEESRPDDGPTPDEAPAPRVSKANIDARSESVAQAEPEIVCRMEAEIGSRVKKKVCRAKSEVEATTDETQKAMQAVHGLGSRTIKTE
jgi:hypothetical protein